MNEIEKTNKKTHKCYYCKTPLVEGINICPVCNKKQSTHVVMKISLFAVIFGFIIFLLIISNEIFTYDINSIVTIGKVDYKVTSFVKTIEKEKWMGEPEKDHEFVIVTLAIKNNNKDKIKYNYEDWLLINENDYIYKPLQFNKDLSTLKSSDIDNIKSTSKVLIYSVKIKDKNFKLRYYNTDDLRNQFQIKLN